jgi:hypothetical protein
LVTGLIKLVPNLVASVLSSNPSKPTSCAVLSSFSVEKAYKTGNCSGCTPRLVVDVLAGTLGVGKPFSY